MENNTIDTKEIVNSSNENFKEATELMTPTLSSGPYIDVKHAVLGKSAVANLVNSVKTISVMKQEDTNFLMEHADHLGLVLEKVHMWRTDLQKKSIVNDINHPTVHSKFHQSILEQKVQFEQAMYLAKEFEDKKIEVENLQLDMEDKMEELQALENEGKKDSTAYRRAILVIRDIQLKISFAQFQLQNMKIAMEYRMAEVRGWQVLEEDQLNTMREAGMTEEDIWSKDTTEIQDMFFKTMHNLHGINKTTDAGEYNNLILLAVWSYQQAKEMNILAVLLRQCDDTLLKSVAFVEDWIRDNGMGSNLAKRNGDKTDYTGKPVVTDAQMSAKQNS